MSHIGDDGGVGVVTSPLWGLVLLCGFNVMVNFPVSPKHTHDYFHTPSLTVHAASTT